MKRWLGKMVAKMLAVSGTPRADVVTARTVTRATESKLDPNRA